MAESRVVFTKSKMNKDLDERILTPGEYRDGFNISVSKSEGPDEGVVENVLGNTQLTNFTWDNYKNVDIIGVYEDTNSDRIFIFATNFTDSSDDQLSEFAYGSFADGAKTIKGAGCFIAYIDLVTGVEDILVSGNFLNFSKTHPIYAVDLVEDLLFWTDNRNQPRKINVETAIANPETYYLNEDHISVSKYMPYKPLQLVYLDGGAYKSSMINETEQYLAPNALWPVETVGANNILDFNKYNKDVGNFTAQMYFINLNFPELGVFKLKSKPFETRITYDWPSPDYPYTTDAEIRSAADAAAERFIDPAERGAFEPNDVLAFFYENPEYNTDYDGDEDYLKDRFIRFSYRFKYDDGEYSLMAPFTQIAFVPKQYGYFIDSSFNTLATSMPTVANTQPVGAPSRKDERDAAATGVVKFMENQVSTIKFNLPLPEPFGAVLGSTQQDFADDFKVESIQILAKESDGLSIKVIEEIEIDTAFSGTDRFYIYDYLSNKPFKTLPEAVSTRVHDKVPIRALAQATTGNRVMYGNFIEKHGSPDFLNYFLGYTQKPALQTSPVFRQQRKEYPNHTVKQNRSYKVGVVLVDRYGRSSNVILRDPSEALGIGKKDSTIYAPYSGGGNSPLNWPGNSITVNFIDPIPTASNGGYPGTFTTTNPLGYYSYKIVVQQQQQDYYNVYLPGATSGIITFTGDVDALNTPDYIRTTQFSNIVLFGDNINKVPKELADVGPTEEIYGSETLLFPRVVTTFIVASSNISTDATVTGYIDQLAVSESSQIKGKFTSTVNSIISFNDLGTWTSKKNKPGESYPSDLGSTKTIDPLYLGASANPFVAQISTDFIIGLSSVIQKAEPGVSDPKFSRALNVFETDPVESRIEIYYEATTSGTIEDLNDDIDSGTGFIDADNVDFTLLLPESSDGTGTPVVVAQVEPLLTDGSPAGYGTVTLDAVENKNNYDLSSDFQLTPVAGSVYNLEYTGAGIPVVADIDVSTLDFDFTVNGIISHSSSVNNQTVTNVAPVAGADWQATWNGNAVGAAGVVLNSTVFLNYALAANDFFRNGCVNAANYYNGVAYEFSPYTGPPPASASDQIQDVSDLITLGVLELIPRGTVPAGLFELYSQSGPPSVGIQATSAAPIASYPLTLRVTDRSGSGLFTDFDFDLILT